VRQECLFIPTTNILQHANDTILRLMLSNATGVSSAFNARIKRVVVVSCSLLSRVLVVSSVSLSCSTMSGVHKHIKRVLFTADEIKAAVQKVASQINSDYANTEDLVVIGILKGSFMFMADLIRFLQVPNSVEFMALSSYGNSTTSTGAVRILMDLRTPIEGKDILIVEDIIDSGLTLNYLVSLLGARKPKSISIAVLLRKKEALKIAVDVKYVGLDIPLVFVVGYGLDYAEQYRSLPYLGELKEEVYSGNH